MWEYVIGGAALFGLIAGLFSVYNGRASRKLLREMLTEHGKLLERLSDQHSTLIDQHNTMIKQHGATVELLKARK